MAEQARLRVWIFNQGATSEEADRIINCASEADLRLAFDLAWTMVIRFSRDHRFPDQCGRKEALRWIRELHSGRRNAYETAKKLEVSFDFPEALALDEP